MKFKNILLFIFFTSLSIQTEAIASDPLQEEAVKTPSRLNKENPFQVAFDNIEKNKGLLDEYLADLKTAELHFFWTTGRTISEDPKYCWETKVNVGGLKYGPIFFPYIAKLLEVAPANLRIKFVCDSMTQKQNQLEIEQLKNNYGARFEILPIYRVQENILKTFDEYQQEKLDKIFKNATQGSPVIASDIYRLIGMIYGQDQLPEDISQVQYTYCDVDELCYGIKHHLNKDFIKALFETKIENPFSIERILTNNDVIKLRVKDIQSYKEFCERILNQIHYSPVLTHFSDLHDIIKLCENESTDALAITSQLPHSIRNLISRITETTGPVFLMTMDVKRTLSYPDETVGEWYAKEEILNYNLTSFVESQPSKVVSWDLIEETSTSRKASDRFVRECDDYVRFISAALYSLQFGPDHPFNKAIKEQLIENYPYHSESFKDLLKANFNALHTTEAPQNYNFRLMGDFSDSDTHEEGNAYIDKDGDNLKYIIISTNNEKIENQLSMQQTLLGQLWTKEMKLTQQDLTTYNPFITDLLKKKGLARAPKNGLSYKEWKENASKHFMKFLHSPNTPCPRHYERLHQLLKLVGVEIPFKGNFLEIKEFEIKEEV